MLSPAGRHSAIYEYVCRTFAQWRIEWNHDHLAIGVKGDHGRFDTEWELKIGAPVPHSASGDIADALRVYEPAPVWAATEALAKRVTAAMPVRVNWMYNQLTFKYNKGVLPVYLRVVADRAIIVTTAEDYTIVPDDAGSREGLYPSGGPDSDTMLRDLLFDESPDLERDVLLPEVIAGLQAWLPEGLRVPFRKGDWWRRQLATLQTAEVFAPGGDAAQALQMSYEKRSVPDL